jgi:hypothetical protein
MMEEEGEKSRGFKVEDKRRFSSEGDLKPEFEDAADPAPAPAREKAPEASAAAPEPERRSASQPAQSSSPAPEPSITFATFLVGLSTQALVHLGEIPDPGDGQLQRDLEAARQIIDLIGVIRDKTQGNLDKDEQAMIDAILFDLRMKYVELAKSPGA